ncbi:hypothetical protein DFR24_3180 [Panacagrimonas perspica]|uniref:OpgC protein n=1 Tax=Panacagrimonas perspica TaxID=381431 RepID=A0A4R7P6W1_9GAMM|nr:OpgC domain-containing protein [Panacagrimonas perspica]TDU28800.1 hypothetical protein DFR24_3180 [Panacagrimonas perspica]THD02363.1 hypothetical protein B1810_15705 [Panacagrimonas perspica]
MNTPAIDAGRNDGLDALRGLFLVLMTLTHLPTGLSSELGQPFGQLSAAEGFVMLSAFLAGQVYLRRGMRQGFGAMRKALWSRAATVYRHHLALFGFGITMVLLIGIVNEQAAITNLFTQYMASPIRTAVAGLLLIYQPALFDILPMYVMFLLLTPWVLEHARRHGWSVPLVLSVALWTAAMLGLRTSFHQGLMAITGLSLPMAATGSFNPFAWQLIWVIGLWLGTARLQGVESPLRASPRVLVLLAVLVATFLVWRHTGGQTPFGVDASGAPVAANQLIDKWDLGPLRLINVFAWAVLIAAAGPAIVRRVPLGFLARLGRSSLPVFSAHLVCCLLALAVFGEPGAAGSSLVDVALILGSLLVMQATAIIHQSSKYATARPLPRAPRDLADAMAIPRSRMTPMPIRSE